MPFHNVPFISCSDVQSRKAIPDQVQIVFSAGMKNKHSHEVLVGDFGVEITGVKITS
jgi:hypothetical protein